YMQKDIKEDSIITSGIGQQPELGFSLLGTYIGPLWFTPVIVINQSSLMRHLNPVSFRGLTLMSRNFCRFLSGLNKSKGLGSLLSRDIKHVRVYLSIMLYERGRSLTTHSDGVPFHLSLVESLWIRDSEWHFVAVAKNRGTWHLIDTNYVVVGDCKNTPPEIEIVPQTTPADPEKFELWLRCTAPPTYLSKGQVIAQAIPSLPERVCPEGNCETCHPQVSAVTAITRRRPEEVCKLKSVQSRKPLDALTVFTDASGGSHKSVVTWKNPQTQQWESDVAEVEGSPQIAELAAVVRAFERFSEPFNLITDSSYVAGVVSRAENAILQEVTNITLFELLSKLTKLVSHREQPYYVMHTRAHTDLPGFIAEGNRRADALAAPLAVAPLPNIFEQAKVSHQLFHQNVPGLVREFKLTRDQAKAILATCPNCQRHAVPTLHAGVNPRGLSSNEVWQMDVTHVSQFGKLRYVHVSVDTFSGAVYASAHSGEKAKDVIKHLLQAFSFLGIPKVLKTDNGPGYTSRELRDFLQRWGVSHKTGIPYSPTGQAIVERTHQNIKRVLEQQGQILKLETPHTKLARALFTLNFLNCSFEVMNPPIIRHFGGGPNLKPRERPPVLVKDPETLEIQGPHELITWGRGYACVLTPTGIKWVPAKWVRPYIPKASSGEKHQAQPPVTLKRVPAGHRPLQLVIVLLAATCTMSWMVPQPKANVWRTLPLAMGQDHICLSQGSAQDPIASCLNMDYASSIKPENS
ncbi:hypothetical protein HGM15179_007868, partial [Zosterops borbonicus]